MEEVEPKGKEGGQELCRADRGPVIRAKRHRRGRSQPDFGFEKGMYSKTRRNKEGQDCQFTRIEVLNALETGERNGRIAFGD